MGLTTGIDAQPFVGPIVWAERLFPMFESPNKPGTDGDAIQLPSPTAITNVYESPALCDLAESLFDVKFVGIASPTTGDREVFFALELFPQ